MVRINYVTPHFRLWSKINRSNYLILARYANFTGHFVHPLLAAPLSSAVLIWDQRATQDAKEVIFPHKADPSLNTHHIVQGFLQPFSSEDGDCTSSPVNLVQYLTALI